MGNFLKAVAVSVTAIVVATYALRAIDKHLAPRLRG